MISYIRIRVTGLPKGKGSAKAFYNKGMRFPVVTNDNPNTRMWEALVADAARAAHVGGIELGPVDVEITFYLPRPMGHYHSTGSKKAGQLKGSAPAWPAKKPDGDKLVRATLDPLKGIIYKDDGQVVDHHGRKRWADDREPGADITITSMQPGVTT